MTRTLETIQRDNVRAAPYSAQRVAYGGALVDDDASRDAFFEAWNELRLAGKSYGVI